MRRNKGYFCLFPARIFQIVFSTVTIPPFTVRISEPHIRTLILFSISISTLFLFSISPDQSEYLYIVHKISPKQPSRFLTKSVKPFQSAPAHPCRTAFYISCQKINGCTGTDRYRRTIGIPVFAIYFSCFGHPGIRSQYPLPIPPQHD